MSCLAMLLCSMSFRLCQIILPVTFVVLWYVCQIISDVKITIRYLFTITLSELEDRKIRNAPRKYRNIYRN